ncbi:MAG: hydrogenase maturation nickel metallochaperone HypA [Bacillota bacterium]|nr:hydrogenase maturation nickel metallochaperone HypA [Bacillota bacterium]MDW7684924.1 hydrogenase maturation nickel metallochaperone HypA [Bacillota bacterium]
MHELSLVSQIITQVGDDAVRHGLNKVYSVTLAVGRQAHVQADALTFGFDAAKRGTVLQEAELVIVAADGDELEVQEYEGERD